MVRWLISSVWCMIPIPTFQTQHLSHPATRLSPFHLHYTILVGRGLSCTALLLQPYTESCLTGEKPVALVAKKITDICNLYAVTPCVLFEYPAYSEWNWVHFLHQRRWPKRGRGWFGGEQPDGSHRHVWYAFGRHRRHRHCHRCLGRRHLIVQRLQDTRAHPRLLTNHHHHHQSQRNVCQRLSTLAGTMLKQWPVLLSFSYSGMRLSMSGMVIRSTGPRRPRLKTRTRTRETIRMHSSIHRRHNSRRHRQPSRGKGVREREREREKLLKADRSPRYSWGVSEQTLIKPV